MISVLCSTECLQLMKALEISPDQVLVTVNQRHHGLLSDGFDRLVAARWFDSQHLVLVDAIVTRKRGDASRQRVYIEEVTAQIAIRLCPNLPAGILNPDLSMEEILELVARSFGLPVICHPEQPPATLYAGQWDGNAPQIVVKPALWDVYVTGSFYPEDLACELVWALDLRSYWLWSLQPSLGLSRMSLATLTGMARSFTRHFPSIRATSEAVQYGVAATVLRAFFGDEWCDRQLLGTAGAHPRFQQEGVDEFARMKAQSWTVALAEMIFNLQEIPGFFVRLDRIRQDALGLEATVAELEFGRLLMYSDLSFRFLDECQRQGDVYEAEVDLPAGGIAYCEVKAKENTTKLGKKTIVRTLKKAAGKERVEDLPVIVFLRLPESWITDSLAESIVDGAISAFFRGYRRVITVVLFWEEWHRGRQVKLVRLAKFREISNPESRFYDPRNVALLKTYKPNLTGRQWTTFSEIVATANTDLD